MSKDRNPIVKSTGSQVARFLKDVAKTPVVKSSGQRGRLIFAMDATASREPTWDYACHIQGQMFEQTAALGGLEIQLCYFRGYGEFSATPWLCQSGDLLQRMTSVSCQAGQTQIERVISHAVAESKRQKVNALVYVGDCMEEDIDQLCSLAGQLALCSVPMFIFHEGGDPVAATAFQQLARISKGAYCPFDASSAQQLKDLLTAVAVYAAGGYRALENYNQRKGHIVLTLDRPKKD